MTKSNLSCISMIHHSATGILTGVLLIRYPRPAYHPNIIDIPLFPLTILFIYPINPGKLGQQCCPLVRSANTKMRKRTHSNLIYLIIYRHACRFVSLLLSIWDLCRSIYTRVEHNIFVRIFAKLIWATDYSVNNLFHKNLKKLELYFFLVAVRMT